MVMETSSNDYEWNHVVIQDAYQRDHETFQHQQETAPDENVGERLEGTDFILVSRLILTTTHRIRI